MKYEDIKAVYFIGAGGIGMSALIRYFLQNGIPTGGYDRTSTPLTQALITEGAQIHFEDNPNIIPETFRNATHTLVVYTPAIPEDHQELIYFKQNGFELKKRAEVLGILTHSFKGLCVAGTHGKTTTSTMVAHLLHQSHVRCNAFLGGISKNYGTNYLHSSDSPYVVIEADEFDRSFHWLTPYASVITATDADHLDIYHTAEAYLESFNKYSSLIQSDGYLVIHTGLAMQPRIKEGVKMLTYSRDEGDFHAENVRIGNGEILFDLISPFENIRDIQLGVPVSINIENGIAAMALAQIAGATADEIKRGMASFEGVDRRFDFKIKTDKLVFLSDYAHHPMEIKNCILSLREVFNGRKLTAIFQPHLYTRTRDFYHEFADSLSLLDEVVLTDIYPARELPIEGITSEIIYRHLRPGIERHLVHKNDVPRFVAEHSFDVLIILGAGDLDDYVPELTTLLTPRA